MKNLLIVIISILAFTSITSNVNAQSDRDQIEVQVDGLGCPFCAYGLEKKFKEFKSIKDVKIELETGQFSFTYPADEELGLEDVESQVEKAGYTAVTTKIIRADGKIEESKQNITELTEESQIVSKDIFVSGNCGMCKARIEKTAKQVNGVVSATWDEDSKMLKLEFDSSQTSIGEVSQEVAKAGHDTKYSKAEDNVYNNLPGCCQYERAQ